MKNYSTSFLVLHLLPLLLLVSEAANAGIVQLFKDEQGRTNWQYVANWSSGILILLLSISAIILFFSRRQTQKSNAALKAIRSQLEQRVQERTATLDESNRLLKEANQLLEGEIALHKKTAERLQSSEAYIKNVLESMPLILIGLNKDREITQWNKYAERITGVSAKNALGMNLWKAYPTITVLPRQVNQALENKQTVTIEHSQRGQYHFDIVIYPLSGQSETGVVILIDDVTEKILAENMLIQRDKMSSMGELASTMAQDINVPLEAMLADVKTALEHLPGETDKTSGTSAAPANGAGIEKLLTGAVEEGQKAAAIINNLLSFAASSADKKRMADIPEIMDHSLDLARDTLSVPGKLRFRDIAISKKYEDDLPKIPCYISELQQVFLSLFRHACYALAAATNTSENTSEPIIDIEIFVSYGALWIKVHHNGVGLSPEEQQAIFEPFFSSKPADNQYEAAKRLSFSHFIITEHHQGQMAVTSDVNLGTTFHIQIQVN